MAAIEEKKSIEEINHKIRQGKAVVVTADEMVDLVAAEGPKKSFQKVDVVTTGTFGTMCSSGAFINFGHTKPKIKASKVWFNEVEAYAGLAAVDCYLGAAQVKDDDPLNKVHPGRFAYGGGHVIEDLIAGREVHFQAKAYGTDCYPLTDFEKQLTIHDLRNAFLFNPRNSYQNYNVATNVTDRTIYTYLGILRPHMGNVNYSTTGQLSPLLNDPFFWTIGVGTKIFLGGAVGSVAWHGTQHAPNAMRSENGQVKEGAGTVAVVGDMKAMSPQYIRGASLIGYGTSLMVGLGIPIPIINEEMAFFTGIGNRDIWYQIIDYGNDYPNNISRSLGEASFEELASGQITLNGKTVPTAPLASYYLGARIAEELKEWIRQGRFTLGVPQIPLPTVAFDRERYPKIPHL